MSLCWLQFEQRDVLTYCTIQIGLIAKERGGGGGGGRGKRISKYTNHSIRVLGLDDLLAKRSRSRITGIIYGGSLTHCEV